MRTTTYLIALLATGLMLGAAGPALANDESGNETRHEKMDDVKARHAALKEARNASLAAFKANRTAAIEEFHAAHNATKASFLENKTRVLAECNATRAASTGNATGGENTTGTPEHAKCVRDGIKPLIEKARAEHKAAKADFKADMLAARTAAMEQFRAHREAWRASHNG